MKGIQASINNGELTLVIPLAQDFGLSKSERTRIIASSQGNVSLSEISGLKKHKGIFFGLNIFTYKGGQVKRRKASEVRQDQELLTQAKQNAKDETRREIAQDAPF